MITAVNQVLNICDQWFVAMVNNWIMCIPIVIYLLYLARDFFNFIKKLVKGG